MPARWMVVAGAAIAGAIAGLLVGWSLWGAGERKVQEVYAKEEVQKDGSILAEKKPGALRPSPVLPKGATVERVIQVKVKPNATPTVGTAIPGSGDQSAPELPTTTLDLTLVKLADGTRRVVLKSPDGTIQGAVDSPMLLEAPTKARVWALGAVLGAGEVVGPSAGFPSSGTWALCAWGWMRCAAHSRSKGPRGRASCGSCCAGDAPWVEWWSPLLLLGTVGKHGPRWHSLGPWPMRPCGRP